MKLKSSLQKFSLVFLLLCFLFLYGLSPRPVLAAGKIFTFDASLSSGITTGFSSILSGDMSNFSLGQASTKFFEEMLPKMGAKVLSSVLRTALNQIAFDTANSLASGGKGQKPRFLTQGWGPFLQNAADSVAGNFIEEVSKQFVSSATGGNVSNFSFCNPGSGNLALSMKISLGLKQETRGEVGSNCSFRKIKSSLSNYTKDPGLMNAIQNMFEPTSNDIGLSLSLQSSMWQEQAKAKLAATKQREEGKGWLSTLNFVGDSKSFTGYKPKTAKDRDAEFSKKFRLAENGGYNDFNLEAQTDLQNHNKLEADVFTEKYNMLKDANGIDGGPTLSDAELQSQAWDLSGIDPAVQKSAADFEQKTGSAPGQFQNEFENSWKLAGDQMLYTTKDAFVDAANTFLNQLALQTFTNMMRKLGEKSSGAGIEAPGVNLASADLANADAGPDNTGAAGAKAQNAKMTATVFADKADYNVLGQLTSCPNPTNAKSTECVLDDKFRDGITNGVSVGEALDKGYLKKEGVFGFETGKSSAANENSVIEPSFKDGYPYRSMLILRKYRVLPVGWEIAAQLIRDGVGNKKTYTIEDMVNCFTKGDAYGGVEYDSTDWDWCAGLVDPRWILKIPKQYCKRIGPGGANLMKMAASDKYFINRDDQYCGDEQSCIKESKDGSCEVYGYCTSERRTWRFGSEACDPVYNTCNTYKNGRTGQTLSLLRNSMSNNGNCDISTVGCLGYCTDYDYANHKWTCESSNVNSGGNLKYFDRDIGICDQAGEGCTELIRTAEGVGANLLFNGSFEQLNASNKLLGWEAFPVSPSTDKYSGRYALKADSGFTTPPLIMKIAANSNDASSTFSMSAMSKNCSGSIKMTINGMDMAMPISGGADWTASSFTQDFGDKMSANANVVINLSKDCLLDNVKIERAVAPTVFSDYGFGSGMIYEKIVPPALKTFCDNPTNATNIECANYTSFAQKCDINDVGCKLYKSQTSNFEVPGQVSRGDYCLKECVGYNSFTRQASDFDGSQTFNFLASKGQSCSVADVGCSEFTNLDAESRGGEAVEYYSHMRICSKPGSTGSKCEAYYSWEGNTGGGYKLKQYNLDSNNLGTACTAAEFNSSIVSGVYNPDCREFYDKNGTKSYYYMSKVAVCDDNCHPFRNTLNNTIYNAIAEESSKCTAAANGCREYAGAQSENKQTILAANFDGGVNGWSGASGGSVSQSTEALRLNGHSLLVSGTVASTSIYGILPNKNYLVSFLVKTSVPNPSVSASIGGATSVGYPNTPIPGSNIWSYVRLNIQTGDVVTTDSNFLINLPSGGGYIDDVKVEQVDRHYLLKDSVEIANKPATPDMCVNGIPGTNITGSMVGCDVYVDGDGITRYLRNFSKLCKDNVVGCELMIKTNNSSKIYSDDVPGYYVYDKTKQCNASSKGCTRYGKQTAYGKEAVHKDVYLKDDPDNENRICDFKNLNCEGWSNGLNSLEYFIDPGENVCEYRQKASSTDKAQWFAKKVKRCGGSLNDGLTPPVNKTVYCLDDSDCTSVKLAAYSYYENSPVFYNTLGKPSKLGATSTKCLPETEDTYCATTTKLTLGYGGLNSEVVQPTGDKAGLCPAKQSTCAELIEPLSKNNANLIFNPTLSDLNVDELMDEKDGWQYNATYQNQVYQVVNLEPSTYYVLGVNKGDKISVWGYDGKTSAFSPASLDDASQYEGVNGVLLKTEVAVPNFVKISTNGGAVDSVRFKTSSSTKGVFAVVVTKPTVKSQFGTYDYFLRKLYIDYQMTMGIDRTSCTEPNYDDGCILFNERKGTSTNDLLYDADISTDSLKTGSSDARDSNILLKVKSDRVCDTWLSCRTWAEVKSTKGKPENICTEVASCNRLDTDGRCSAFYKPKDDKLYYTSSGWKNMSVSNFSGYSSIKSSQSEAWQHIPSMPQLGDIATLSNGGFEEHGDDGAPSGWLVRSNKPPYTVLAWTPSMARIIFKPQDLQKEGAGLPPEGKAVLGAGPDHLVQSLAMDPIGGNSEGVYLSVKVNTSKMKGDKNYTVNIGVYDGGSLIDKIRVPFGVDWREYVATTSVAINSNSTIVLHVDQSNPSVPTGADPAAGSYFVDDIVLRPVLQIKATTTPSSYNNYEPQSCRLFPENDSPSCSYKEEASNIVRNGWRGYCLEWDRYPGNSNTCLMWWPVEKVASDNFADLEGYNSGYTGRTPAFYCTKMNANFILVEKRRRLTASFPNQDKLVAGPQISSTSFDGICPDGYGYKFIPTSGKYYGICDPVGIKIITGDVSLTGYDEDDPDNQEGAYYQYNGSLIDYTGYYSVAGKDVATTSYAETWGGVKVLDLDLQHNQPPKVQNILKPIPLTKTVEISGTIVTMSNYAFLRCDQLEMTVTASGDNKAWAARNGPDSIWLMGKNFLDYTNAEDQRSFGAVTPPNNNDNPATWDTNIGLHGNQPLSYFNSEEDRARFSAPYHCFGPQCKNIGKCADSGKTCLNIGCYMDPTYPDEGASSFWQESYGGCIWTNNTNVNLNDESRPSIKTFRSKQFLYGCEAGEQCEVDQNSNPKKAAGVMPPYAYKYLSNVYIKSYGSFGWKPSANNDSLHGQYVSDSSGDAFTNFKNTTGIPIAVGFGTAIANEKTPSYVAKSPIISNKTILPAIPTPGSSGMYTLSFNTFVYPEQMPLKQIIIDWNDGSKTVVSGDILDKPDHLTPHIFYHYYSKYAPTGTGIIRVYDNWGYEGSAW